MTRILFFGRLRDVAGHGERVVELPPHVATIADLRSWIADGDAMLGAALHEPSIRVVVDQIIRNQDNETVRNAAEIAFMPPLSGG